MILNAIKNCIEQTKKRNWDKTFWAFDIHGTILVPNYTAGKIPTKFYPHAKKTLQLMSKIPDICMILYTCSHPHEIEEYLEFFKKNDIHFKYVGKNPEVVDGAYGYYRDKFYFNVLFEDKAGFDPKEWSSVYEYINSAYDFNNFKWQEIVEEDSHENFFGYNLKRVVNSLKSFKIVSNEN